MAERLRRLDEVPAAGYLDAGSIGKIDARGLGGGCLDRRIHGSVHHDFGKGALIDSGSCQSPTLLDPSGKSGVSQTMLAAEGHRRKRAVVKGLENGGALFGPNQQAAPSIRPDDSGGGLLKIGKGHRRAIYDLYQPVSYGCRMERLRWSAYGQSMRQRSAYKKHGEIAVLE